MNTPEEYFRLVRDTSKWPYWFLNEPFSVAGIEIDPRDFTCGVKYNGVGPLKILSQDTGPRVEFNFASFDMIVVNRDIGTRLEIELGALIQRIPVEIDGTNHDFEVLNILDLVDCVDEQHSDILWWAEEDGRPDKIGSYRMVSELVIATHKARGHGLFRIASWPIALVASDRIVRILNELEISGLKFQPVRQSWLV